MKKYIYIPSFDTGCSQAAGKKNYRLSDGTPWRFWSEEFPEYYRHKAFLVTAGHSYKNFDHHKIYEFGDDVLRFGDSGGFQIASGVIKYEMKFVDTIFRWLENNSNIAINLDIPPRMKYEGKFQECLDISKANFKYFADNQTGKTDFLNVLHGSTYDAYQYWYDNVCGMPFKGWAIGGAIGKLSSLMDAIVLLAEKGELKNPNNKWLHILGASSVSDFIILAQIQKSLFEIDSNITLTTDSSSPSRSTAFGIYYTGFSIKDMKFQYIRLPRLRGDERITEYLNLGHIDKLPEIFEFDKKINDTFKLRDFLEFTTEHYSWMVVHNLIVFLDCYRQCNEFIYSDYGLLEQMVSTDMYKLLKGIDEILKSSKPYATYTKFKPLFDKMSRILPKDNISMDNTNEFF